MHGAHNGGVKSNTRRLFAPEPAGATPPPPPSGISLRATAIGNNGAGGSTLTIGLPPGTTSGDVMVAFVVVQTAGNAITPPVGGNPVLRQDSSASIATSTYVKGPGSSHPPP